MGHVDHGKTSLLDALRKTDVALKEAGGITQRIGAYQVAMRDGRKITFVDTPGHAAFTEMRSRGANITDVVVLVVAADDSVKDQTIEAVNHAKAAGVPIVVAINKVDKHGANPEQVRKDLLNHEVVVEAYGGEVINVEISAKTGIGLERLEEAILLQAEVLDLKANPNRSAEGIIIESKVEKGLGPVATVLINKGTLRIGDIFVSGTVSGRVRAIKTDLRENLTELTPGMPGEIIGFNGSTVPGDDFIVVNDESKAKEIAAYRDRKKRDLSLVVSSGTAEQMFSKFESDEKLSILSVIVKTDVQGSSEAICSSLHKLSTEEVAVKVLHSGIGEITESDVALARASSALIVGFNVRANMQARDQISRDGVKVKYYSIIYDLIDDVKNLLSGMLTPDVKENILGSAEVRKTFDVSKLGRIAGCMVTNGLVKRGTKARLIRDGIVVHSGGVKSVKRHKDDVKEVKEGFECGIVLENYNDIHLRDVIECFELEEVARQL
jgi:translation initiation factor IF-2